MELGGFRKMEMSVPMNYWNSIPVDDQKEFIKLRNHFHTSQKTSMKDRRLISFSNELHAVLKFIEMNNRHVEERCILVGVCFAGPFICVNTRQLKNFLGRCKSSINGSFQQLGYIALRTKSKARGCILSILPSLHSEQNILRQWTVRCASEDSKFCFLTKEIPAQLPCITEEDIYDERKLNPQYRQNSFPMQVKRPQQLAEPAQRKRVEFELPEQISTTKQELVPSFSSDSFGVFNGDFGGYSDWGSPWEQQQVTRSHSSQFDQDPSLWI